MSEFRYFINTLSSHYNGKIVIRQEELKTTSINNNLKL